MKIKSLLVFGFIFVFVSAISAEDFLSKLPKLRLNSSSGYSLKQISDFEKRMEQFETASGDYDFKWSPLNKKVSLKSDDPLLQGITKYSESSLKSMTSSSYSGIKYRKEYKPWESKKRFYVAAGEILLLEFIPFAMSAYIKDWSGSTERNWTKISFKTMWHNLSSGWFYDGDNFLTNFFAHPYHGGLFYNAGRTNGYNFWESSGFAMAGSAIWEHLMETWEPAFNDWVLTSMNGINLGEVTYRLSTLVTDNTARGSTRMWTEIAGFFINPVRAFNRLISGETSRIFPNPSWRTPDNLYLTLDAGMRRLDIEDGEDFARDATEQGIFGMELEYGNILKDDFKTPFSSFALKIAVAAGADSSKLTNLQSVGTLYGFNLKETKKMRQLLVASLRYDYTKNPGFLFGAASIEGSFLNVWKLGEHRAVIANAGVLLIPMGGTPNDYFAGPEGRNYDFGPGLGYSLGAAYRVGRWNIASAFYRAGMIWTQSEPANSKHFLHVAQVELQYPMKNYFVVGVSGGVYWRNSFYSNFDDVDSSTPILRIFFKTAIL